MVERLSYFDGTNDGHPGIGWFLLYGGEYWKVWRPAFEIFNSNYPMPSDKSVKKTVKRAIKQRNLKSESAVLTQSTKEHLEAVAEDAIREMTP